MVSHRTFTPLIVASALLLAGCAKKRVPKHHIKPAEHYNYTHTTDNVTLKVAYVSPQQFAKKYPSQLHQHRLLDEHETYVSKDPELQEKRVRLLQGTLINKTDKKLYISRKNISLPVISPHEAHTRRVWLRNVCWGWSGFWGAFGLFMGYLSFAIPPAIITCGIGLGLAIPGIVGGSVEHLKEKDRKEFVHDTMLHNTKRVIHSGETCSWFMMVPYRKYSPRFAITCKDSAECIYRFEVDMQQHQKPLTL